MFCTSIYCYNSRLNKLLDNLSVFWIGTLTKSLQQYLFKGGGGCKMLIGFFMVKLGQFIYIPTPYPLPPPLYKGQMYAPLKKISDRTCVRGCPP